MTEDQINTKSSSEITQSIKKPLTKRGVSSAMESAIKAQDSGSWPKRKMPQPSSAASNPMEETQPTGKKYKEPLTKEGLNRAKGSIKKAQDSGSWPKKETPQSIAGTSDAVEKTYPTEKKYPEPEVRRKILDSLPNQEQTIPSEIKEELTKEAEKLDTMTMEPKEEKTPITTELPKVKPFIEEKVTSSSPAQAPETLKAQGGAEPLKRIMKAQEEMDQEKVAIQESAPERMKARIEHKQVEVPSEAKSYIPPSQIPLKKPAPQPTVESAPQETTQPLKPKQKSFISRAFAKIFRKK